MQGVEFDIKFGDGIVTVKAWMIETPWISGETSMPWKGAEDEDKFKATPDYEEMKQIALTDLDYNFNNR